MLACTTGTVQEDGITFAANMACSELPAACASVADTETAFRLYGELRAEGVRTDCQVYTALITACSRRIQGSAGYISRWAHAVYQAGLCSTLQAVVGISTGSQLQQHASTSLHCRACLLRKAGPKLSQAEGCLQEGPVLSGGEHVPLCIAIFSSHALLVFVLLQEYQVTNLSAGVTSWCCWSRPRRFLRTCKLLACAQTQLPGTP